MEPQPPAATPMRPRRKTARKKPAPTGESEARAEKPAATPASQPAALSPEGVKRLVDAIFRVLRSL